MAFFAIILNKFERRLIKYVIYLATQAFAPQIACYYKPFTIRFIFARIGIIIAI